MLWPSTRSDCLRAIGHLLDAAGAAHAEIEEDDVELQVHYTAAAEDVRLRYSRAVLADLLAEARARRGTGSFGPPSGYEQKLRVVGGELDRQRGHSIRIRELDGTLGASYISRDGLRVRSTYTPTTLANLLEVGPRRRQGPLGGQSSS